MKKLLFIFCLIILLTTVGFNSVFAAAPTPTPTSSANALEQQIENLKDKIASRVAELNLVEKRGEIGTVTDVTTNQITLNDIYGNTQFVDVDELTQFSSPSASSSFGISDITKGSVIGVLGLYNKESHRILARFVNVLDLPVYVSGAITNIDRTNYTITVLTATNNTYNVDIEDATKTYSYDGTSLNKSGFSKTDVAERVIVIGYADAKDAKHLIASRVLIFPTLPIDPAITVIKPQMLQLQGTITPSVGSGKKLTPLTK